MAHAQIKRSADPLNKKNKNIFKFSITIRAAGI